MYNNFTSLNVFVKCLGQIPLKNLRVRYNFKWQSFKLISSKRYIESCQPCTFFCKLYLVKSSFTLSFNCMWGIRLGWWIVRLVWSSVSIYILQEEYQFHELNRCSYSFTNSSASFSILVLDSILWTLLIKLISIQLGNPNTGMTSELNNQADDICLQTQLQWWPYPPPMPRVWN